MSIPDIPTPPDITGQSRTGLRFHILGSIQQTLMVEVQPNQMIFADAGSMSWMTSAMNMNTRASGGLGELEEIHVGRGVVQHRGEGAARKIILERMGEPEPRAVGREVVEGRQHRDEDAREQQRDLLDRAEAELVFRMHDFRG